VEAGPTLGVVVIVVLAPAAAIGFSFGIAGDDLGLGFFGLKRSMSIWTQHLGQLASALILRVKIGGSSDLHLSWPDANNEYCPEARQSERGLNLKPPLLFNHASLLAPCRKLLAIVCRRRNRMCEVCGTT